METDYSALPLPILHVLRRGLEDSVKSCQNLQIFFAEKNDHDSVASWSGNERYYQKELDLVKALIP